MSNGSSSHRFCLPGISTPGKSVNRVSFSALAVAVSDGLCVSPASADEVASLYNPSTIVVHSRSDVICGCEVRGESLVLPAAGACALVPTPRP